MNKDFQLKQLLRMLMAPGLKSGLYLLETDLTDEEIEECFEGTSSFKYVKGKLIPTSKGNVFELFIVGLCHQCPNSVGSSLMNQLITADERNRDVIIYSLTIQTLKHFCSISEAMRLSSSSRRAAITTLAPIFAYSRAIASPIPDDAPVTTTTLLLRNFPIFTICTLLFYFNL